MTIVSLSPLFHRNEERIAAYFPVDDSIAKVVKKIPGATWSKTQRCWHLPFGRNTYDALLQKLNGIATVDDSALRKKKSEKLTAVTEPPKPLAKKLTGLSDNNLEQLQLLTEKLKLKAYSSSTIRTYTHELQALAVLLGRKKLQDLTPDDLKRYMLYCLEKLGLKENSLHSRLNALKFYYEQVLGKEKFFYDIPRPKKPLQLPKLLNENEIRRLFNALRNKKHKAMLFTAYSAGLRLSEIVNLKIADIDSGRMQIFIERAKGKKDRCVNLSPVLLDILRSYIGTYRPRPRKWLFESEETGAQYPPRTIQQIFYNAKARAFISKEVGIHSLRHSFATHLLDKGTDIKYIKDLLGHFDIRTTERYLHVSKQLLVNIVSPFDDLWKSEKIEW